MHDGDGLEFLSGRWDTVRKMSGQVFYAYLEFHALRVQKQAFLRRAEALPCFTD